MRFRVLVCKLGYLSKLLCDEEEKLSAPVLHTLACEDVCIVIKQYRSLEFSFGTNHFHSLLQNPDAALATLKTAIYKKDIL